MNDYIETLCGAMPNIFKDDYKVMSDKQIIDLVNGTFVDPFALSEMLQRKNIALNGNKVVLIN